MNGWVIRNRQPLLILSPDQARQIGFDDRLLNLFEMRSGQTGQRLAHSQVPQSLLIVPIITGDQVLGVINIQSYTRVPSTTTTCASLRLSPTKPLQVSPTSASLLSAGDGLKS